MKKRRYLLIVSGWLVLFILMQFACVKRIPRFAPGDEFLSTLSLMSQKDYRGLLDQTDDIDLSSLSSEQADKIAFLAARAAVKIDDYARAERYLEYCLDDYTALEDYVLYYLAQAYFHSGDSKAAYETARRCIEKYPDSIWFGDLTVMTGQYLAGMDRFDEALGVYDTFLSANKKSSKYPSILLLKATALEAMGKKDEALAVYKEVWIGYPAADAGNDAFSGINRLGGVPGLTTSELKRRIDNLYAAQEYGRAIEAIAQMPALLGVRIEALPAGVRKELEYTKAKSYFKSGKYGQARELFGRLLSDPGNLPAVELLYWRARSDDRLDKKEAAVAGYLEVFRRYPKNNLADDSLYLAARTLEEMKRYDEAISYYETYLSTYSRGGKVKDALWFIGWLHYVKKEYAKAEEYFARMAKNYKGDAEYPKYLYWQGRAAERQGRTTEAIALYQTIAKTYIATYYGLLSQERLPKLGAATELLPAAERLDEGFWTHNIGRFSSVTSDVKITSHLTKALELMTMNLDDDATRELALVVDRCVGDPSLLVEVARLLRYSGDYYTPILIAVGHFKHFLTEYHPGQNDLYWQMKYPRGYKKEVQRFAEEYGLDPSFVYAVMREESLFQPRVSSWAGAIGLMQIIPPTGKTIAADLGVVDFEVTGLSDYETNIRFGTYYLSSLMKEFDGNPVYALCGYNAGPGNAKRWIKNADPDEEIDEFIESIPFSETRAYVKRILNTESIYRALYEGDDQGK